MIHLREYREKKGLTQKELGEAIGVTASAITYYELGKRKPDYEKLVLLAQALGCAVDDLIGEGEPQKPAENQEAAFVIWLLSQPSGVRRGLKKICSLLYGYEGG